MIQTITIYLLAINLLALLFYGVDKYNATKNHRRISEHSLLLLAIAGGSVGAIFGMRLWHHKTQKKKFYIGVPLILLAQLSLAGWIYINS